MSPIRRAGSLNAGLEQIRHSPADGGVLQGWLMDSKTALRYLPSVGDQGRSTALAYYMKFAPRTGRQPFRLPGHSSTSS